VAGTAAQSDIRQGSSEVSEAPMDAPFSVLFCEMPILPFVSTRR